jgi:hypothetical protein
MIEYKSTYLLIQALNGILDRKAARDEAAFREGSTGDPPRVETVVRSIRSSDWPDWGTLEGDENPKYDFNEVIGFTEEVINECVGFSSVYRHVLPNHIWKAESEHPLLMDNAGLKAAWALFAAPLGRENLFDGTFRLDLPGTRTVMPSFACWIEKLAELRTPRTVLSLSRMPLVSRDVAKGRQFGFIDGLGNHYLVSLTRVKSRAGWNTERLEASCKRLGITLKQLMGSMATPEGREYLCSLPGDPDPIMAMADKPSTKKKRRLAKKGDKGTWKEHVEKISVDGPDGAEVRRIPTGEETPVRVTEDQKPGTRKVKVVPAGAPSDDGAKEVPARDVEIERRGDE